MSAVISTCGKYRYRLERPTFLGSGWSMGIIMVNPSTADATTDDPTIRKCIGFAERQGAGSVIVGNKFAFRSTDVRGLRTAADPVGPENDVHLEGIMSTADLTVVAWGPLAKLPKSLRERWRDINFIARRMDVKLWCFGKAADGHPRHPLMQSYDTPLTRWFTS